MKTFERLEECLRKNMGDTLPDIRYFNGNDSDEGNPAHNPLTGLPFSCADGSYAAATLEGALDLFLKSRGF